MTLNVPTDYQPYATAVAQQNAIAADVGTQDTAIQTQQSAIATLTAPAGPQTALQQYLATDSSDPSALNAARTALQAALERKSLAQRALNDAAASTTAAARAAGAQAITDRASQIATLKTQFVTAVTNLVAAYSAFDTFTHGLESSGFDISAFLSTQTFVFAPFTDRPAFQQAMADYLTKQSV